jgi:hypothetical protein
MAQAPATPERQPVELGLDREALVGLVFEHLCYLSYPEYRKSLATGGTGPEPNSRGAEFRSRVVRVPTSELQDVLEDLERYSAAQREREQATAISHQDFVAALALLRAEKPR